MTTREPPNGEGKTTITQGNSWGKTPSIQRSRSSNRDDVDVRDTREIVDLPNVVRGSSPSSSYSKNRVHVARKPSKKSRSKGRELADDPVPVPVIPTQRTRVSSKRSKMERDRPSLDGSSDSVGKDSSGGDELKTPAAGAADDLADVKIRKDDDFAGEVPSPSAFLPNASLRSASTSTPTSNNDDLDLSRTYCRKGLEHAAPVEPIHPPGRQMPEPLERPPVVLASNHDVVPGAFAVSPSLNRATSRTSNVPMGLYNSSRGFANEETKQEEGLSELLDANLAERHLHTVEAQLVQEEIAEAQSIPEESMKAKPPSVRMKWYQHPLYRWISVGSIFCACSLVGSVIVLVVVLSRQPAASSTSSLASPTLAPLSGEPPSPAPTTGAPSTRVPSTAAPRPTTSLTPEQAACNFLSSTDLTACRSRVTFDHYSSHTDRTTGSTIPSEIGLLTQLTRLDFSDSWLSSTIPSEIGLLTQLNFLGFARNKLTSTIPSEIGRVTQLTELWLSTNQLSGAIPSEMGRLTQLTVLFLDTTQLAGSIPSSLCSHVTPVIYCGNITCQAGCCYSDVGTSCG